MANYPKELTDLVQEYLTDGVISTKERQVLLNKAQKLGIDVDEFDLYIDAQQQKSDMAVSQASLKKKGKTCPFCGASLPMLTDKCPECGGTVTPEASADLQEIIDNLENALVDLKSGKDIEKSKAVVERYVRKAKLYYEHNPKVQKLLSEVLQELERANSVAKKKNLIFFIKRNKIWIVVGFLSLLLFSYFIIRANNPSNNPRACIKAVKSSIKHNKLDKAVSIYREYCAGHCSMSEESLASPALDAIVTASEEDIKAQVDNGDLVKAVESYQLCMSASRDSRISAITKQKFVHALIENDDFDTLVNLFRDCENRDYEAMKIVVDEYVKQGDLQKASAFYNWAAGNDDEHKKFIFRCIDFMNQNGFSKNDIKSFIEQRMPYFPAKPSSYVSEDRCQASVRVALYKYAGI